MSVSKRSSGRSRSAFMTPSSSPAATTTVISPSATLTRESLSPSAALSAPPRLSMRLLILDSARDGVGAPDLVLELNDAVEQGFRRGRATGHVDVDRHDAVASAHDGVGVVVVPSAVGARAHRNHPPRFGHLVIDLAQRRCHLVAQRAG